MLAKDKRFSSRQMMIIVGDLVVLLAAPFAAAVIYVWGMLNVRVQSFTLAVHPTILINIALFLFLLYLFDQYNYRQDFRKISIVLRVVVVVTIGAILISFLYYLLGIPMLGRRVFIVYCTLLFMGFLSVRLGYSLIGSVGIYDRKALIVGYGDSGRELLRLIKENRHPGVQVIGFLDVKNEHVGEMFDGVRVYKQEGRLLEMVKRFKPQLLIVAMRRSRYYELVEDLTWCAQQGIEIWDVPTAYERLAKRIPLQYVDEMWLLFAAINWPKLHTRRLKRVLDIGVALCGLVVTFPIMVITTIAVRLESDGPVILVQKRLGKQGRLIGVYKFRSMYQREPLVGEKGTCVNDARVTRVGRIIRKLHIDELPQLVNVIRGDLSIVGPRAELYDFINEYIDCRSRSWTAWETVHALSSDPESRSSGDGMSAGDLERFIPYIEQRFTVQQGITGWAQVMHPYVTSSYEDMVTKLEYDLYYIKNMSLVLDIVIMFMTVRLILLGKGK
jgi:lipopolysaccharide/colanic/teichoic acid biosynthesis glycosyltransferase